MYRSPSKHKHYDIKKDLERIRSAFSDTAKDIKGRAEEILWTSADNLKEKRIDLQKNISHYVAKKPFKSLSIVLASGFVLGLLMRRNGKR